MNDWHSMETAPKGIPVFVYVETWGKRETTVGEKWDGEWHDLLDPPKHESDNYAVIVPRGWMPFPEPPR